MSKIWKIFKAISKGYALWFWYYFYKPYRNKMEAEAKRKIEICKKCNHLDQNIQRCNLCGCFMTIKVKSAKNEDCYDGRWGIDNK
jgi:hypothetical protein